jgi:hypothetical protein
MVDFLDGVLPLWLAAVPPGDVAAAATHQLALTASASLALIKVRLGSY